MDRWDAFREATARIIAEPWWRCLAEALAVVESGGGRAAIEAPEGLNEIGYKAIAGRPSTVRSTREADAQGRLQPATARFRLFADRGEQAAALLWLLRSSVYYEAARLLFVLAFYAAYAPGRTDGARELLRVFNERARAGLYPGVRPFALIEPGAMSMPSRAINHAAARQAVRLFAQWTGTADAGPAGGVPDPR